MEKALGVLSVPGNRIIQKVRDDRHYFYRIFYLTGGSEVAFYPNQVERNKLVDDNYRDNRILVFLL